MDGECGGGAHVVYTWHNFSFQVFDNGNVMLTNAQKYIQSNETYN